MRSSVGSLLCSISIQLGDTRLVSVNYPDYDGCDHKNNSSSSHGRVNRQLAILVSLLLCVGSILLALYFAKSSVKDRQSLFKMKVRLFVIFLFLAHVFAVLLGCEIALYTVGNK